MLEPEGYRFTVDGRSDTAPAVFPVSNRDQYILVEATAPSGAHWQQKIEVRAYTQTVLRLRHAADTPPPTATPAARFVGVLYNTTHRCSKAADRVSIRLDITTGTQTLTTNVLEPRSRADVTLAAGSYTVRRYNQRNGAWEYGGSQPLTVAKDGWTFGIECAP